MVELWTVHDGIHVYGQYGLITLADEMLALPEFEEESALSLEFDDSDVDQNIDVVIAFFEEAWNDQQFDLLEELIDFDSYMHADYPTAAAPYLHEDMRADWEQAFQLVPDVSYAIQDVIGGGDRVAVRFDATWPQDSGGPIRTQSIMIFQLAGGKIVHTWTGTDNLHLLGQYGVVDVPAEMLALPDSQ